MGRPAKPTALKIVSGTDQPCRVRNDEPMPESDNIEKPEGMSPKADIHWDKIKKTLLDCKVLTNVDNIALAMLCTAIAEMFDIQSKLDQTGIMIRGRNNYPVISPYFRALNQKQDQVRRMLTEFGMTPSSRTRVGTFGNDEKGEFDF